MKKLIPILASDPNSINSEIIVKTWKKIPYRVRKNIFIIGNFKLLKSQIKLLKLNCSLNEIKDLKNFKENNKLKILNVHCDFKNCFKVKNVDKKKYILKSFEIVKKLIKNGQISKFITCPLDKKSIFEKKRIGVTELLSSFENKNKSTAMMIYNEKFSVIPITNHINLKDVSKNITKRILVNKITNIFQSYKKVFKKKPKAVILGLNPHNDEFRNNSEEKNIVVPAIKLLAKNNIKIDGPVPADTIFFRDNLKKFNLVIGMYHDQVLPPIKALFGLDAINVTLGLNFLRVSPDHGTGTNLIGKNKASPKSLIKSINFVKKYGP
jgi:4-hydroxy-L-threonine phosphate dehydrogenase PdxA